MEHPFLVAAIMLVSLVALAQPKMWKGYGYGHSHGHGHKGHGHKGHVHKTRTRYCYPNAELYDECDIDKRCAYNRSECPGAPGCHLICTSNPYKLCNGRDAGDDCIDNSVYQCWPDHTGQLVCVDIEGICGIA